MLLILKFLFVLVLIPVLILVSPKTALRSFSLPGAALLGAPLSQELSFPRNFLLTGAFHSLTRALKNMLRRALSRCHTGCLTVILEHLI
jgi:hypothetical protein